MNNKSLLFNTLIIVLLALVNGANAQVLFSEDFENGTINDSPNPVWSWRPNPVTDLSPPLAVGNADFYSVSDDRSVSGAYSWRLDFGGRNDWGNQCGSVTVILTQADIDSGYIPVLGAPWNDALFNKGNGFSKWQISSFTDAGVNFNATSAIGDSLTTTNGFTVGDELKIPYKCGVNGIVGGNINRRSDVDGAINYLDGASNTEYGFGESISRSFYLYIPSETDLPNITLKLGYLRTLRNGSAVNFTLKLSVQRGLTLELSTPGGTVVDPYSIQTDQWQYFEETWTRESAAGLSDGKYILNVRKENESTATPVIVQDNVTIGSLVRMSVNGNFQNNNDASGYIYFDDFVISTGMVSTIYADSFE